MKKKVTKSYILNLPKTYNFFYQKPTKIFDIYTKWDKSITITTHDPVVFKNLLRDLGTPTKVFPPVNKGLSKNYISGASWTFNYFKDREKTRNAFKMSNYIPRKKDICN